MPNHYTLIAFGFNATLADRQTPAYESHSLIVLFKFPSKLVSTVNVNIQLQVLLGLNYISQYASCALNFFVKMHR